MVDEVSKLFWTKKYRPVTLILDPDRPPVVIDPNARNRAEPQQAPALPPIDAYPSEQANSNSGAAPIAPPSQQMAQNPQAARDLESGIYNEVLRVMRQQGYNVAALKVFAQTMNLVKVIMIVSTQNLPDRQIRPTLRQIRAIIETEVLQAKYPGVHLAELSSFTLLNERDGHFYEHPVLYWQLDDPQWHSGQAPAAGAMINDDGPSEGQVSAQTQEPGLQIDDYFNSNEFVPEVDFDEKELLDGPIEGL